MPAQVGRADLLRALVLGRENALALDHTDTVWWGYVPPQRDANDTRDAGDTLELRLPPAQPSGRPQTAAMRARSALRMPEVWETQRLREEQDGLVEASKPLTAFEAQEIQPPDEPRGSHHDLLPLPRLAGPLAVQLRRTQAGGVDLAALLQASIRRRWPPRLPRLGRQTWPAKLVLMLDVGTDLFPYRYDMCRVSALIQGLVPRAQLRVLAGAHGPFGSWGRFRERVDWVDADKGIRPESECTYLLLSDMGLLRPASEMAQAWKAWLDAAHAKRCACVALAPVAVEDVSSELTSRVRLLRWSPDSRLRPERGRPQSQAVTSDSDDVALHELLACLSATLRMDPPMLRVLRQNSRTPLDASLEGRLWAHADVRSTTYACLRPERVEFYQAAFRWQGGRDSDGLRAVCAAHHAHWPLGMRLVDEMQQITASPRQDSEWLDRLHHDLMRLAHSVRSGGRDQDALTETADYVLRCASNKAHTHLGAALDALAHALGMAIGPRLTWCLLQRGQAFFLVPATDIRSDGPGVVLCSDVGQAAPGELMRIAQPRHAPTYLRLPPEGLLTLPPLLHGSVIMLGGIETRLQRRHRIRGVWGWEQSHEGVMETLDLPWSNDLMFPNEGLARVFALLPTHIGGEVRARVDFDNYGLFLELASLMPPSFAFSQDRPLLFRFRYLEPSTFLQGSAEAIGHADERPQHPVTFTQGLWLAETPCTLEHWQAVMGKNLSRFHHGEKGLQRPVENVSFHEVMMFLKKLQIFLPRGCEAVLPSESQWEYACRAGTSTEYWWGDVPEDLNANWKEQHNGTTSVKHYAPNPWGFHDMHGNVWEWCRDGKRDYASKQVQDPEGPDESELRVVRGGSWIALPAHARAAFRPCRPRWHKVRSLGFRFALKFSDEIDALSEGLGARRRGVAESRINKPSAQAVRRPRRKRNKKYETE